MPKNVTFWRQLDGQIIAQKDDQFFSIPAQVENPECEELHKNIANNFDDAPMKQAGMDILGAVVIRNIPVAG